MKFRSKTLLVLLALIIVSLTTHMAIAGKPEKLSLAMITDMTGPYAPTLAPTYSALLDAAEYVNKNGGIKGVPIEIISRDCKGKVDIGIGNYVELKEMNPRPQMIYGMFSPLGDALKDRFNEDKYPVLWSAASSIIYPPGYAFGIFPTYADQAALFIQWLADNWKEQRAPRLAFLTWDSSYGKAILEPTVYAYAKSKGVEIVATELFGLRDVSVTNQMMKIRAQKADWIYTNSLAHGPVLVAKAAKEIGYQVGLAGGMGFDNVCLALGKDLMEGFVGIHGASHWNETSTEGVQLMDKYMQKNKRPEKYKTSTYPISWAAVIIFSEIMERTVDKHGWDGLTGPNIKKEMEGLENFKILKDLWLYSYSSTQRSPRHGKVFQVKNGKIVPVTAFQEMPDMRPAKFK
jgi:branched-chain amino acid transport system substrate-binding protein